MLLKNLYVTLTNNPIRIDEDIQHARDQYEVLSEKCTGIEESLVKINEGAKKSIEITAQLDAIVLQIEEASKKNEKLLVCATENEEKAEVLINKANTINPEMDLLLRNLKELQKTQDENQIESSKILKVLADSKSNMEELSTDLNIQVENDKKVQEQIKQTLQDVNKHGMAGAFMKKKRNWDMY